jgi:precorrin-6B methylase 2
MTHGIAVINAATLETLASAAELLERQGFETDVCQVSVSRSKQVHGRRLLSALNPIFIITGEK